MYMLINYYLFYIYMGIWWVSMCVTVGLRAHVGIYVRDSHYIFL